MHLKPIQPSSYVLSDEQKDTIIDAILQGKYSRACLHLLEAIDYDPLHYMPYRTYNRLQKQRQQAKSISPSSSQSSSPSSSAGAFVTTLSNKQPRQPVASKKVADLDYIELLSEQAKPVTGGQGYWNSFSLKTAKMALPSNPLLLV